MNKDGNEIQKYGFSANTIGKHIKNLKRILNEATKPEININKYTYYTRFKVLKKIQMPFILMKRNWIQCSR